MFMQNDISELMTLIKETNYLYARLQPKNKAHFYIVWDKNPDYAKIICRQKGKRVDVSNWRGKVAEVCDKVRSANEKARAELEALALDDKEPEDKDKFNFEFGITLKID